MESSRPDITTLLADAGHGDRQAWEQLIPLVYQELKGLAEAQMRHESQGNTLEPTALVHEAFERLVGQHAASWNNRRHFYGAAAEVMRRILVDHARRRRAQKRGGGAQVREPLDQAVVQFEERSADLLALDEALTRLAELEPHQAKIVELRFFGGLSVAETADVLGVSESTVERGWRMARAWLLKAIREQS